MSVETGLPRIPGVSDHVTYLAFLDNKKACDEHHKRLVDQYTRLMEAISVYGKAKDIEKLHGEAEALKASVLSEIEKREAALKERREKFEADQEKGREANGEEQRRLTELASETKRRSAEILASARAEKNAAEAAWREAQQAKEEAEKDRAEVAALKADLQARVERAKAIAAEAA